MGKKNRKISAEKRRRNNYLVGIFSGLIIGVVFGFATSNIIVGIIAGLIIGLGMGHLIHKTIS
ncbi:septum formation initiator [Bacteroidia bacterium]|nr:septum formation initiator [Bacteroidia bacterium]MDB4106901.1 septum formation initiator [Bacteroidia bacterium]MDB9882711.1 septum formation initiator [Bacteroidia bacterium]